MVAFMLAYMVPYEGVQIKFKLYVPLGNGAERRSSFRKHDDEQTNSNSGSQTGMLAPIL